MQDICSACSGRGYTPIKEKDNCTRCGGSGYVNDVHQKQVRCERCLGKGTLEKDGKSHCVPCSGTGKIDRKPSTPVPSSSSSSGGGGGICGFIFLGVISFLMICFAVIIFIF